MQANGATKYCPTCKRTLPLNAFSKHVRTKDKLQNSCKECKARINKNWKYSLKSGRYEELVKIQNSCCSICHTEQTELVVDHCHKTNRLRALLCRKCNALLGMCNDNQEVLSSAIAYLKRWDA